MGAKTDRDDALKRQLQEKAAQRQSVLDALMQQKTQADITESLARAESLGQPEPAKAPTTLGTSAGIKSWNPKTGTWDDTGFQPPAPVAPRPTYDATRGAVVDIEAGTAKPVAGLPDRPVTATGGRPTEAQMRANLVTPRAEQAAKDLMEFYETGAPIKSLASQIPIVGNFALSEDEQRMTQAAEVLASAVLRLESGAAITESEIKSYARQLLPVPGDSPEVLAQKKATVAKALDAMRAQSTTARQTSTAAQPTREQALWDAAVAKHGEAVVLEKFGPRP